MSQVITTSEGEQPEVPANVFAQTVTQVNHYTDRMFSFRITRPASLRFRSGEFVMIGLPGFEKPVFRAYSISSPSWDEELEFFSIKVPDGPLTEHLQKIKPGDTIWMRKKPTGTLVLDALIPGKRLFMLSTGTGIAPFASLIRDPECYEKFDQLILTHTCRLNAELQYGFDTVETTRNDPLVGELVGENLIHFTSTTRDQSALMGRITDLIVNGSLFEALGVDKFDPENDRVMICGSTEMTQDLKTMFEDMGFEEGANSRPASFVIERAFVG
ncbi:MAG: ferredoxin--NADP reductase [Rhizobiaceae bacterium]|nr:ferredoxin--NADP reductase [Rhizobiaceae bacterium]